ncbi:MAG TPA: bifunctional phosphoglucose/phosphomannose isomerase [Actinomycetota bacterium]|nr:bifunctional phosphoglucose/phosphomannose isomerase [Actinomycetota bacterium]
MIADVDVLDDSRRFVGGATTMLELAASLGDQLVDGFRTGVAAGDLPAGDRVRSIVVCGMGGSGIVGDVLRSLYVDRLSVPLAVVKGYGLPEYCGRDTLVVAASFSGHTEETLAAFAEALDRGCRVVTLSAGGTLRELAAESGTAHVDLPASIPVPRAAVGFAAGAAIGVLDAMGLVPPTQADVERAAGRLSGQAQRLGPGAAVGNNMAKDLAAWIGQRVPVVWGSEGIAEAAALRWKTQMNENAKVPAFAASLPELDHNDVEGWRPGTGASFAAIALRHRGEHARIGPRVEASKEAVRSSGLQVREVLAEGSTPLESLLSLVMTGDFASVYLGVLRGVDPLAIPILTALKERLRQ